MPHAGGTPRATNTDLFERFVGFAKPQWIAQLSGTLKAFRLPTGLLDLRDLATAPALPPAGWVRLSILNNVARIIDSTGTNILGAGITTFLGLTDTPGSYAGQAGKVVAVNGGATALEFVAAGGGGGGSCKVLNSETADLSITSDPAEQDLHTYTLPANEMADGDMLRVSAHFTGINADTEFFRLYVGGTLIDTYSASEIQELTVDAELTRRSASGAGSMNGRVVWHANLFAGSDTRLANVSNAITWTSANVVKFTEQDPAGNAATATQHQHHIMKFIA